MAPRQGAEIVLTAAPLGVPVVTGAAGQVLKVERRPGKLAVCTCLTETQTSVEVGAVSARDI